MNRIKSIDILRGLSMTWMMVGHLLAWWIRDEDRWFYLLTFDIFDPIGAAAFLFVAGISSAISYNNRIAKIEISDGYNKNRIRNEYLLRAFFILIVALIYNLFIAIGTSDPYMIWTWFILLTVAISLFIGWPLLKTSKLFRIFLGIIFWIVHIVLFELLYPFRNDYNYFRVLYHILYNKWSLDPILPMFPFFLFGTVLGELLFDVYRIENQKERKSVLMKRVLLPLMIIGPILIIYSVSFKSPPKNRSYIWLIYSLGIQLTLLSVLLFFEEFIFYKTKKSYKFLFYYSYYSLVIYLAHNVLYFLFYRQLNKFEIWIYIAVTFIIIGLIFRFIYKKWDYKASLKAQLGKLASGLAKRIEEKKVKKITF